MKRRAIQFLEAVAVVAALVGIGSAGAATPLAAVPEEVYTVMGTIGAVAIQPDGKIIVANPSAIYSVNTVSGTMGLFRSSAARFNRDGSLDRSFSCNIEPVEAVHPMATHVAVRDDGHILISGLLRSVDGRPRSGFAMLLPDGRLDDSFDPSRNPTNMQAPVAVAGLRPATLLKNGCVAVVGRRTIGAPYLVIHQFDSSGRLLPAAAPRFPPAFMFTLQEQGFWLQKQVDWTRTDYSARQSEVPGLTAARTKSACIVCPRSWTKKSPACTWKRSA